MNFLFRRFFQKLRKRGLAKQAFILHATSGPEQKVATDVGNGATGAKDSPKSVPTLSFDELPSR